MQSALNVTVLFENNYVKSESDVSKSRRNVAMIIDSHIHLSHILYDNEFPFLTFDAGKYFVQHGKREQLIDLLRAKGISACVEPGIDIDSNHRVLSLADRFPGFLFSAVGVHPTRTYEYKAIDKLQRASTLRLRWNQRSLIDNLSNHPSVVAIGETGLDYHLPRKQQHRLRQKVWFIYQLRLACKKKLPVILHIREADKDAIRILRRYRHCLNGGVCHCFSGSAELARAYVELGLKLGIGGTLLMDSPKKTDLEQAVFQTPLEYILLETDGPFVKPSCPELSKKQIGKARNTSLILPSLAQRIAEIKNASLEDVIRITSANAVKLFNLSC